ncbi:hypothetical protein SYNPS1DRAFT_28511 [Syncephalis pseudoplumigaleata]|uniref:small monomeric GTPase n=1 Tax=Syncephalis pseudoplumigaleata TaxID=1712513 RepID=A0A4P9Z039_9FUNG|nr:hypothetical protein SYNPS1DRAFT_28511 [Syncephalis pseudoplumigaleata]|eukprot:RKP25766.1 hypothetical protein SYNPS1DRAFT_28511 [Syncephalis pseudoplumigaleata]
MRIHTGKQGSAHFNRTTIAVHPSASSTTTTPSSLSLAATLLHRNYNCISPPSNSMSTKSVSFNISIHGAQHVGKTRLCGQFLCQSTAHSPSDDELLDMPSERVMRIADRKCTITVVDTSFAQQESAFAYLPLTLGHAAVLIYSVADAASFQTAIALRQTIRQLDPYGRIPLALVATKGALDGNGDDRKVSAQEGIAMAAAWDCPFFEIGAADTTNSEADVIFATLAEELLAGRDFTRPSLELSPDCCRARDAASAHGAVERAAWKKPDGAWHGTAANIWSLCHGLKQLLTILRNTIVPVRHLHVVGVVTLT